MYTQCFRKEIIYAYAVGREYQKENSRNSLFQRSLGHLLIINGFIGNHLGMRPSVNNPWYFLFDGFTIISN